MKVFLPVLIILLSASASMADSTWVQASDVSGIWNESHSPYIVLGDINIPAGDTLQIGPGTRIEFAGPFTLTGQGVMLAEGTESDSIVFTSKSPPNLGAWGGMQFESSAEFTQRLRYCLIENSSQEIGLPALATDECSLLLEHSVIRNCVGHAVRVYTAASVVIEDCAISNCGADFCAFVGGAFVVQNCGNLTINRCSFTSNHAADGGAIHIHACTGAIENCLFDADWAYYNGGAIIVTGSETQLELRACAFRDNCAIYGGAICFHDNPQIDIEYCTFDSNIAGSTAAYGRGGVIASINSVGSLVALRNCTMFGNHAFYGNGTVLNGRVGEISNCIFSDNQPGNMFCFSYDGGLSLHHNCFYRFQGFASGPHSADLCTLSQMNARGDSCDAFFNILLDPVFADTASRNFRLQEASPCINAGDPLAALDPDSSVADLGRYYFVPDLGADEPLAVQPESFTLTTYPNPFNGSVRLSFDLPHDGSVRVSIFNLLGEEIKVLAKTSFSAGHHELSWNAAAPSGTYFAVLNTDNYHRAQKLLLLR